MFKIPLFPKAWVLSGPGTHRPLKRGWRRQAGQREDDVGAGGGAGVKTRQGCTVQERIQTAYQVQWESQRDLRQVDMVWVRE